MILLTSTSDKIRLITGSTGTIHVHASWGDLLNGSVTLGRTNTIISTTTTTDIVAPPASSTYRNIKSLHIRNAHASSSNLVSIIHTDGTNAIELFELTLLAGENVEYVEGKGFQAFNSLGQLKSN